MCSQRYSKRFRCDCPKKRLAGVVPSSRKVASLRTVVRAASFFAGMRCRW
jgi:hypothetical protein